MSAKPFPPYRVEGSGIDAYIVDSSGADVVVLVSMSRHYNAVFDDAEIMLILCDALNAYSERRCGGIPTTNTPRLTP